MAFSTPIPELIARNSNGLLGKHPSWERVRLGDVVTVQNGAAFKSEYFNTEGRGMPLLRIRDIVRGATETWYDGPFEDEYIVCPGDLVIGMDGDFNHDLWAGPPALLNQRVCRLRFEQADALLKEYVFHVLGGYLQAVNEATPSVTVKHLSSRTVADLLLPLPPVAEQRRVASELGRLLTIVNAGRGRFARAKNHIEPFRRSLVNAEVQALQGDACVGMTSLDELASESRGLFTDGDWVLAEDFKSGRDVRLLQLADVGVGEFRDRSDRWISFSKAAELEVTDVLPGDILISRMAAPIARACVVPNLGYRCITAVDVAILRVDPDVADKAYLMHVLNSPAFELAAEGAAAGVTRKRISRKNLGQLRIPLPDTTVQRRIAQDIEGALEQARAAWQTLAKAEAEVDVLLRSLRRSAVLGELSERLETDGDSSALLQRIEQGATARKTHKSPRKNRRAVLTSE